MLVSWSIVGILLGVGAFIAVGGTLAIDRPDTSDRRFQSTLGSAQFDGSRYVNFRDYVEQTRRRLETDKVFMAPATAAMELEAATPFETVKVFQ